MKYTVFLFVLLPFFAFGQVDTAAVRAEVDSLFDRANRAIQESEYSKTLDYLNTAEAAILTSFGRNTKLYLDCLKKIDNVYFKQGEYSKSESLLAEILSIREGLLGKNNPTYAGDLDKPGINQSKIGFL